jgi:hypothetical protein
MSKIQALSVASGVQASALAIKAVGLASRVMALVSALQFSP